MKLEGLKLFDARMQGLKNSKTKKDSGKNQFIKSFKEIKKDVDERQRLQVKPLQKKDVDFFKSRGSKLRYVLEGGVIRVYAQVEGKERCVKTISIKEADPSIIAQIENLTFADMLMIKDIQKADKGKNTKKKNEKNLDIEKYIKSTDISSNEGIQA